jgi:hypothetical protein
LIKAGEVSKQFLSILRPMPSFMSYVAENDDYSRHGMIREKCGTRESQVAISFKSGDWNGSEGQGGCNENRR